MDYSEVTNAFSHLVETHFLQRCPPVDSSGAAVSRTPSSGTSDNPAKATPQPAQAESHPDCYRLPQIHLSGECLPLACTYFGSEKINTVICNELLTAGVLQIFNPALCLLHVIFQVLAWVQARVLIVSLETCFTGWRIKCLD